MLVIEIGATTTNCGVEVGDLTRNYSRSTSKCRSSNLTEIEINWTLFMLEPNMYSVDLGFYIINFMIFDEYHIIYALIWNKHMILMILV